MEPGGAQALDPGRLNRSVWAQGRFIRQYATRELRPVEVLLMVGSREDFAGRVLELGCGAGRITGYLVEIAREAHGIDLSSTMIRRCRERYPGGTFVQGDILDLSRFDDGSFDAVLAGCNVLDVFADEDRRRAIREARRVLAPGALYVMSSHNRGYLPHVRGPARIRTVDPLRFAYDLVHAPQRIWRHRRLVDFERNEPGYAIVSDGSHEHSLVHYFISVKAQRRQLEQEGFEAVACFDLEGRELGPGETAPHCSELHYGARRNRG